MPEMRVHPSGGITFTPTPQEKEVIDLRITLKKELEESKQMKEEMRCVLEESKDILRELKELRDGEING